MQSRVLSVMIYEALNAKGAGLGNASIGIIEQAIEKFEADQHSVQTDVCHSCGKEWKSWNQDTQINMCAYCGNRR